MADAITRVRRYRLSAEQATLALRAAILQAREEGATLRQIADAAGVTPQRVSQIIRNTR